MSDSSAARPVRKVAVADHIWNAFEQMAQEMGSERDALINQAMFMFARLNGFLEVGRVAAPVEAEGPAADAFEQAAAAPAARPRPAPAIEPDDLYDELPQEEPEEEEVHADAASDEGADFGLEDEDLQQEAEPAEDAAYEEPHDPTPLPAPTPPPRRMPSGVRPPPRAEPSEPPVLESRRRMTELAPSVEGLDGAPVPKLDDDPVRREVAERVLETAAELERLIKGKQQNEPRPDPTNVGATPAAKGLYLVLENGETEQVSKDRYLIGRGKHCDFVINSGKVSREHAAILRDGADYFIEDLGSSNGTWYNKSRIKRRKVEDGDEYFICSEKIRFVVR